MASLLIFDRSKASSGTAAAAGGTVFLRFEKDKELKENVKYFSELNRYDSSTKSQTEL